MGHYRKSYRPPSPEIVKQARLAAGLLQREMADKMGVESRTYCRWERGETLMPEPEFRLFSVLFLGGKK